MASELMQLESRSYGDLLGQIRFWEDHGYDLISGTFRCGRKYMVMMRKHVGHKAVRFAVTFGHPYPQVPRKDANHGHSLVN